MYLFSGKISNAFICYFQKEGRDIYPLLREIRVSEELLCNPDCWIDSEIVEKFLSQACFLFENRNEEGEESPSYNALIEENLLERVGHQTPFLKAWGALDWALRIIEDPWEIFQNSEMLFSYFISPKPKIQTLHHEERSLSFSLPFQRADYPYVSTYLQAAMASLPCYRDKNRATVKWKGRELIIEKPLEEVPLFPSSTREQHLNPSVMSSMFASLQRTQEYLHKLQQSQKDSFLQEEKRNMPLPVGEKPNFRSYELMQNSLLFFKEYLSRKKIKVYQNAFLCDERTVIQFPEQLKICFNLIFSFILSFTEEEETIYIHHSYMNHSKQKWMEVKISFKNKLAKGKVFLSHIKAIEEIITFILEKDGIHLKMEMDSSSKFQFQFKLKFKFQFQFK